LRLFYNIALLRSSCHSFISAKEPTCSITLYWTKHPDVLQDVSCTSRSSWVNSNTTDSTIVFCSVYSTATVQLINIKCRSTPDETVYMPIHYFDNFLSKKLSCPSRLYSLIIRYALESHTSCRKAVRASKYHKFGICTGI
jgi:hypothetical protein